MTGAAGIATTLPCRKTKYSRPLSKRANRGIPAFFFHVCLCSVVLFLLKYLLLQVKRTNLTWPEFQHSHSYSS